MAEMAAKDAGLMGMQSAGAEPFLEPSDSSVSFKEETAFFWQVMTSWGAFNSAYTSHVRRTDRGSPGEAA